MIVSIAWLKPPLVSEDPATRLTEIWSMSWPTTTSAMPPMNWPWYSSDSLLLRVAGHLDAVMTSFSRVTVTEIVSTDSGVAYEPSAV